MSTPLWTRAEAQAATGGQASGAWETLGGISIDTRSIEPGDLFVALTGEHRDGHAFVADALARGAAAALVSQRPDGLDANAPLLIVQDTLVGLEGLAAAARARTKARVIAVTGSVGKTSTKEMLRAMLAPMGRTHAAVRSFNNHWGVPLTLARMPADTDYAVIEIGMNQPGEIAPLSRLARPHVALITSVDAVHMAAFDSVEQIADAKAEIFAGLDGTAVLNADNRHFARLASQTDAPVLTFGTGAVDARLTETRQTSGSLGLTVEMAGGAYALTLATSGTHFALNAAGALAACKAAGADVKRAAEGIAMWQPPEGRGNVRTIEMAHGTLTLLDESYNANPTSTAAALATLAAVPASGRRHAILGDMLELGPDAEALHRDLATLQAITAIDRVHCCGSLMAALHTALPSGRRGVYANDSAGLASAIPEILAPGDVCMVKGSLGAKMARVVAAIEALGETEGPT